MNPRPARQNTSAELEAFDAACERLHHLNVTFLSEPSPAPGNRIVFFEDPDGNILHLIQRAHPMP